MKALKRVQGDPLCIKTLKMTGCFSLLLFSTFAVVVSINCFGFSPSCSILLSILHLRVYLGFYRDILFHHLTFQLHKVLFLLTIPLTAVLHIHIWNGTHFLHKKTKLNQWNTKIVLRVTLICRMRIEHQYLIAIRYTSRKQKLSIREFRSHDNLNYK